MVLGLRVTDSNIGGLEIQGRVSWALGSGLSASEFEV